ncbi:Polyadenylate-binding protein-interacting protein 4-like protein [Drosera capensis]
MNLVRSDFFPYGTGPVILETFCSPWLCNNTNRFFNFLVEIPATRQLPPISEISNTNHLYSPRIDLIVPRIIDFEEKRGLKLLNRMNLHQAVQSRTLANNFSYGRVEKDMSSRIDSKLQSVKPNANPIAGHQVDVQMKNGSVFSGIFHTANNDKDFGIVLKMARLTKDASSQGRMAGSGSVVRAPSGTLIIPANELVQVIAKDVAVTSNVASNELRSDKQWDLMLDSNIPRTRHVEVERELARWVPDEEDSQCPELENIFDRPWTGTWDQFKVNETLFGVKSTFNEELYTTRLEKGPQTRELEEEALRIARDIEGEETHDLHLAEERGLYHLGNFDDDEEARFSSVLRIYDNNGFDEEDFTSNSCNGETFGSSTGSAISRSFVELTRGKSHDDGQQLSSSFPVDEVKSSKLNIGGDVYRSDSLQSENSSWGVHAPEKESRTQENLISQAEQDSLTEELIKSQLFKDDAELTMTEGEILFGTCFITDLPTSLETKDKGFDSGGLSPDATTYTPSNVRSNSPEKTSFPNELSDVAVSSKAQDVSQSKAPPGKVGSSVSSTSGHGVSRSSSGGSFTSEKSTLNPNAKEFKLNPNAKSYVPSQAPLRPLSPVADGSFYFPAGVPSLPHMPGMPIGIGVGPSFVPPQHVIFNPQAAMMQSPQAYFPSNGPQYGQPMIIGHPRQVMYMQGYPTELPYKGREF